MKYWMLMWCVVLAGCGGSTSSTDGTPVQMPLPEPVQPALPEPPTDGVTDYRIQWGSESQQYGVLYLPEGEQQSWPVVVMIHGGCWQSIYSLGLQTDLSIALAERGFAVWNIEYRSLGNGGEWPVMFEDVAAATDYLRALVINYPINLQAVATMGHSAGGHLALWLASRDKIDDQSELYRANPLPVKGAVTLGAITDLASPGACGNGARSIINRNSLSEADLQFRWSNTSPIKMLPTGAATILISGSQDNIVPSALSELYTQAAVQAGDSSEHFIIDGADHFDLISASTMDMALLEDSVRRVIGDLDHETQATLHFAATVGALRLRE